MNYLDLPEFEEVIDRLEFATLGELHATALQLWRASDDATDRGARAILLTLRDLLTCCATQRDQDLDTELRRIIDP